MTQSDNTALDSQPMGMTARIAWGALIVATLYVCYFRNLGAIGLVGPDEPRYAWIARDMAETGDWVTPRLYGRPWFEKPPLYYWSAAASFKLFGVSETAARLPCAIYALLATLALAWLAWRTYGAETARWLLLLLPTSAGMIGFSHAAATDMPFAATLTIAMVFAAGLLKLLPASGIEVHTRSSSGYADMDYSGTPFKVLFGFFLGLAVLAKGPAAIILSGGAVFFWAIFTKRWRDAFRCLHPMAIVAFCVTALPWYIVCARRNPDFFRVFIVEHNFKRFLTPEFQHIQPFWYYGGILLVAFLPWTILFIYSTLRGSIDLARTRTIDPLTLLLICWAAFCVAFFSISKSKLPGYILPAIPAIGLLIARSCSRYQEKRNLVLGWTLIATSLLLLLSGILLSVLHVGKGLDAKSWPDAAGWIFVAFGFSNLFVALSVSANRRIVKLWPLAVTPILILLWVYPRLQSAVFPTDPSGKTLASDVLANNIPKGELLAGPMRRGVQYSLSFYLRREVLPWQAQSERPFLLLKSKNCDAFIQAPWICEENPIYLEKSGYFVFRVHR